MLDYTKHLDKFSERHVGPSKDDVNLMLNELGYSSLSDFTKDVIPASIMSDSDLELKEGVTEQDALKILKSYASQNKNFKSYLGNGYYGTITPGVIKRNILENPGWYTAYTPYQPEVSQGRLEMLMNFQQMIIDLTGMEIANASLLDESTAAAEAMMLAYKYSNRKKNTLCIQNSCQATTGLLLLLCIQSKFQEDTPMHKLDDVLYTGVATATGGRGGKAESDDGRLTTDLSVPKGLGGDDGPGTNPEQMFAAGYAACFIGAMKFVGGQEIADQCDAVL